MGSVESVARISETLPPRRSSGRVALVTTAAAACALVATYQVLATFLGAELTHAYLAIGIAIIALVARFLLGEGGPRAVAAGFATLLPSFFLAAFEDQNVLVFGTGGFCGTPAIARAMHLALVGAVTCAVFTYALIRRPRPALVHRLPTMGRVVIAAAVVLAGLAAAAAARTEASPTVDAYRSSLVEHARVPGHARTMGEDFPDGCVAEADALTCTLPPQVAGSLLIERRCLIDAQCQLLISFDGHGGEAPNLGVTFVLPENEIVIRRDEVRGLWAFETLDHDSPPRMRAIGGAIDNGKGEIRQIYVRDVRGIGAPKPYAILFAFAGALVLVGATLFVGFRRRHLERLLSGA
jgi:hypothetical protein